MQKDDKKTTPKKRTEKDRWFYRKINDYFNMKVGGLSCFSKKTGIPYLTLRKWTETNRIPRPLFDFMNLWLKIPENEVRKSKLVMIPQFRRRKTGTEKVHLILPDGYNSTSVDALRLAPILRPGRFYLFYKDPRLPKGYGLVPTGQEDLRRIFNELIEESERKAA